MRTYCPVGDGVSMLYRVQAGGYAQHSTRGKQLLVIGILWDERGNDADLPEHCVNHLQNLCHNKLRGGAGHPRACYN